MSDQERTYDLDDGTKCDGEVECPHCGLSQGLELEELPWDDGEEQELECVGCGKYFLLKAVATVEHYVAKPDPEDDDDQDEEEDD